MINKYVKLNGTDSGIVVEVSKGKYFHAKDGNTRVFKNLEIAKSISDTFLLNTANRKFHFIIDKKIIALEDCQKVGKYYQYIDDRGNILHIEETKIAKVTSLGYIVFENGDTERCDKKYGCTRVKQLMKMILNDLVQIFCENNKGAAIRNIYNHTGNKEYVVLSKETSARIHIMTNSYLMDVNQARKANNEKVFMFDKTMDKFTTLFVYTSKLVDEAAKVDALGTANTIINYLVQDMQSLYPETNCKYVPVDMGGRNIFTEEK